MRRSSGADHLAVLVIVIRHAGILLPEGRAQGAIEGLRAGLQQKMRAEPAPLHLLFLGEPLGDDRVDGGLDEDRGDAFSGPVALAIIDQAGTVGGDLGLELADGGQELAHVRVACFETFHRL